MASSVTPGPAAVAIRTGVAGDAEALAELFWQVRAENAATIPMVVHPRETVQPFLASVLETSEVWVATVAGDPGAVRFYERHGFVVVGGTDGDNEERAPDLRMEWRP